MRRPRGRRERFIAGDLGSVASPNRGPGHWWPYLLLPAYKLAEARRQTREAARRLGLVTLEQMTLALLLAVENPVQGTRIMSLPEIRAAGV